MSKTSKTSAVVIKQLNYGEADRILTLYTKHFGKVRALAKGVRKLTSRKGGNLELFNRVAVFLVEGKNLRLITEAVVEDSFPEWRGNLVLVGLANYFCELVDKLTPDEQANQRVFDLLSEALGEIGREKPVVQVRQFEEALLGELGFGIPAGESRRPGTLLAYIESVTERKINTPDFLRKLKPTPRVG